MRTTSIKNKLSLINLISTGFIITLLGLSVLIEEFARARTELYTDTKSQAVIIAKNSVSCLLFDDRKRAEELLESLRNISDIRQAAIYTKSGRIIGRYERGDIKNVSCPTVPGAEGYTFENGHLAVFHDVVFDNETIGRVYICADTGRINRNLLKLLLFIVIVSGMASGTALILLNRLQKTIVDPLLQLSYVMNKVTNEKDYSVRTSTGSKDELGMVAGGLNSMLEQIERWNMELEDKVAARTLKLQEEITGRTLLEAELKQAKYAAEAASQAKSEFLANMSHEIRTPINAIIGMNELLMNSDLAPKEHAYAEAVKQSANSLLGLINDILDLSKIEAGKLELEDIDFNLQRVIYFSTDIFSEEVMQKGIVLKVDTAEEVPMFLRGDPIRLRQILINLIGNAVKFTPKGFVTLEVRLHPGEDQQCVNTLLFSVRDTGIGIPGDKVEHIFESFTQADGSTTRRYGGSGLGLYIVMNLVKLMGGTIWVESEGSKGSSFHFTAPFPRSATVEESMSPSPVSFSTVGPLRILHVDDNTVIQNYVVGILEKTAHEVKTAANGKEAIELLSLEEFDVVLLDIQMPDMDGFEVVRIIRDPISIVKNHAVPIIATTAYAMKGDRERCIESGMNDYIAKPFSMTELFQKIVCLLPAVPKEEDVIDQAYVNRLYGGNVAVIRKIRSDFLVNVMPSRLDEIREVIAAGDSDICGRLSHSLKGAAGTIGARPLQDAALQMELAAKEGDMEQACIIFDRLQHEFSRLLIVLQKLERLSI